MEGKRSEETLQIRLYGVDCPEVAHFGNPAQAFSAEAKEVRQPPPASASLSVRNQQPIHVHVMFRHCARAYGLTYIGVVIFSHILDGRKVRVPSIRYSLPPLRT